jgi:hypothetical protein
MTVPSLCWKWGCHFQSNSETHETTLHFFSVQTGGLSVFGKNENAPYGVNMLAKFDDTWFTLLLTIYLPFRPVMLLWATGLWWASSPSLEPSFHGLVTSAGGRPEDRQYIYTHQETKQTYYLPYLHSMSMRKLSYKAHLWLTTHKNTFQVP